MGVHVRECENEYMCVCCERVFACESVCVCERVREIVRLQA